MMPSAVLTKASTLRDATSGLGNYAIISTTPDGVVTSFNATAERWFGYDAAELVGRHTPALWRLPGEAVAHAHVLSRDLGRALEPDFETFVAKARQGQTDENEWTFIRRDGSRFPVTLAVTALRDQDGGITGFLCIIADITERKQAGERLREFKDLFDNAPLGYHELDATGRLVRVNRTELNMLGYTAEELLGQFVWKCSQDEDLSRRAVLAKLGGTPPPPFFERVLRRKDGSCFPVLVEDRIMTDEAGRIVGIRTLLQDITERKRMEEELRQMNLQLEQRVTERTAELTRSNQELEQFAYVASHDMREPLRAVSSFAQMLQRSCRDRLEPHEHAMIGHIVEGAKRMAAIIDDLLALSRIGTQPKPLVRTKLEHPLEVALENLSVAIRERGAIVRHDSLPALPVDASQIALLFQNLIGNAIKFCPDRTPAIHLGAVREPDGFWKISVQDNGIGIAPEHFTRIFEIFQRLHTRVEYPGTGIGLAICQKIVARHGGRIWPESTPGAGTAFYFTLPEKTKDHAPPAPPA